MALYSLVYYLLIALSLLPFFLGAVVIRLVSWPFDRRGLLLHLYSCVWAQSYYRCHPLWHLHIRGREKLPWRGGAVIVANHLSLGDVLVLFGLFRPFKWVSKASAFRLPFLGWNMRLNGYIPLVRGDKASVAAMMDTCRAWLDRGVPVLFFPEGTRSEDGRVKPFKDGAFALAVAANVPVIPVAHAGLAETLPKHGFKVALRADCRVRVLDPIHPADVGHSVERLRDEVRARIIAAKEELDEERRLAGYGPAIAPA